MTTHSGCVLQSPENVARTFNEVRGLRMLMARLRGDDMAEHTALNEIRDCTACLRGLAHYLAAFGGEIAVGFAQLAGGGQADAVKQLETQLADARGRLP